jgi:hypothetical protein
MSEKYRAFRCENCGGLMPDNGSGDYDTGFSCWWCDNVSYPREGTRMVWVEITKELYDHLVSEVEG